MVPYGGSVEWRESPAAAAGPGANQNTVSGNNSVVECDLAKVEVAGSNPVSRSILLPALIVVS